MRLTANNTIMPRTILDYWFANALDGLAELQARMGFWFATDALLDNEIRQRFGILPDLLRDRPDYWASEVQQEQDEAALAKVLVWDQFTRNIYRGQAQAFAYDALALSSAEHAITRGIFERMHPVRCHFLMMPYEHSESLQQQQRGVAISSELLERAPQALKPQFEHFLKYARVHCELIARFGRFPHRNAVLGREASAEETAYLAAGGERFGQ